MTAKVLSEAQERMVARRYAAGESVVVLAKRFSTHTSTITRIALKHGCKRRLVKKFLSSEEQRQVLTRYDAGDLSTDIAKDFGIDINGIPRIVRRLGGKVRPLGRQWKGESFIDTNGYRMLSVLPGDPITDPMRYSNGCVMEHRVVMARHLGRPLRDDESVHHINGKRSDNRIANLQLRQGAHGKGVVAQCVSCGSHDVIFAPLPEGEIQ